MGESTVSGPWTWVTGAVVEVVVGDLLVVGPLVGLLVVVGAEVVVLAG
jgi:hypothetical protein